MKIVAGVVLAGTISAGVGLVASGSAAGRDGRSQASRAGTQGLTYEHYAWTFQAAYLDGPRREALGGGVGTLDAEFNSFTGGRCIRAADDRVVTILGNDYWTLDFGMDEGPAAFLPRLGPIRGTGYGQGIGGIVVRGLPWKGGSEGCVYAYSGSGIWKVWRNEEKKGRWWFRRIAGGGKLAVPGGRVYQGQVWRKQGEKEYKTVFFTKAGFYSYEEGTGGGRFVCLLSMDSLKAHLPGHSEGGRKAFPTQGVVDSGGNYYLGYYFSHGAAKATRIQRVSPDGKKVEDYATHAGTGKGKDGPGMKTGWHCGPHFSPPRAVSPWYPPGILICSAHDEHTLRRIKDGRFSTLYEDGQWREGNRYDKRNQVDGVSGFIYGANGLALGMSPNEGKSRKRGEGLYLIKGIDVGKATVRDGKWGTSK